MLYTLSRSPYLSDLATLVGLIGQHDEVVLLQDGVSAALEGTPPCNLFLSCNIPVYALSEDIEARGFQHVISGRIAIISYTEFVKLTVNHTQQFAW